MDIFRIVQVFTYVIAIGGIGVWFMYACYHKRYWFFSVPPITWLSHLVIFYSLVFAREFLGYSFPIDFSDWSVLLRFHAIALLVGIGLLMTIDRLVVNDVWTPPQLQR